MPDKEDSAEFIKDLNRRLTEEHRKIIEVFNCLDCKQNFKHVLVFAKI